MKVLFVSSGNRGGDINPVVLNQGYSLSKSGIDIHYYKVIGKGIIGYLKNIGSLKREIKTLNPDLVHAHYTLCGIIAKLASSRPLLVSLMGSDIKGIRWERIISRIFAKHFWDGCIVKTRNMKEALNLDSLYVVPNGVDIEKFKPILKEEALGVTNWEKSRINILFPADPKRGEKNFELAEKSVTALQDKSIDLHILKSVPIDKVVYYLNSADVILLTSKWEGSPNSIKEAMACNIPIVSTRVGDVETIFNGTEGCYLADDNIQDISAKLLLAIDKKRTNGRDHIVSYESGSIARKIIDIYSDMVNSYKNGLS